MKLTYKQIFEAKADIEKLLVLTPGPTARLAARIARNARLVGQALADMDAGKDALLKRYLNEEGQFVYEALTPEQRDEVDAEYAELLATEVEVDVHPLEISEIESVEERRPGFNIPTSTFFNAGFLFSEESPVD